MEAWLHLSAVIIVILGLPVVYVLANNIGIEESASDLEFQGIIERVMQKGSVQIVVVTPAPSVPVIFFDDAPLQKGDNVTVRARVQEYRGRLEIVAEEVLND